jgi:hypothetical protein
VYVRLKASKVALKFSGTVVEAHILIDLGSFEFITEGVHQLGASNETVCAIAETPESVRPAAE